MRYETSQLSEMLLRRYRVELLDCSGWSELELWGGIAMDRPTFTALADAAQLRGDCAATLYEVETTNAEFPPVIFALNYESFLKLRPSVMTHFDLVMVPASRTWIAFLSSDNETLVLGPPAFLATVSSKLPPEA